jgi:hypothetical protein
MYQNCCKKCGSISLHTEVKGNNTGLYCDDCGAWIKWLGKDELRAFEHANKSRGLRATAKVYDEAFANNSTDNENISDCLIIGFDKHKGEQTWMSIGRKDGDTLDIVNMIKDERAEKLYKQLLSTQKSVSQ